MYCDGKKVGPRSRVKHSANDLARSRCFDQVNQSYKSYRIWRFTTFHISSTPKRACYQNRIYSSATWHMLLLAGIALPLPCCREPGPSPNINITGNPAINAFGGKLPLGVRGFGSDLNRQWQDGRFRDNNDVPNFTSAVAEGG